MTRSSIWGGWCVYYGVVVGKPEVPNVGVEASAEWDLWFWPCVACQMLRPWSCLRSTQNCAVSTSAALLGIAAVDVQGLVDRQGEDVAALGLVQVLLAGRESGYARGMAGKHELQARLLLQC